MEQRLACHDPNLFDFEVMERGATGAQPVEMELIEGGARMQPRDLVPVPAVCLQILAGVRRLHTRTVAPSTRLAAPASLQSLTTCEMPVAARRCASVTSSAGQRRDERGWRCMAWRKPRLW